MPNSLSTVHSVAEAILKQLQLSGVKRIYGVIGDAIFGLMDAIAKQEEIQFIAVKHESVASMMASAEAKCTGGLGVCVAQMGPGLANLINGLGDAYLDGYPVLAITGQASLKKLGTPSKQYINEQELVQAVTGYSELVAHPDAVVTALSRAIHVSIANGTVVHLSIPSDLFTMPTIMGPIQPLLVSTEGSGSEQIQQALQWMSSAKRPMIMVGNAARSAEKGVQRLAEVWGSGIVMGYGATGIFADSSPHVLGGLGEGGNPYLSNLFKQADVILAVGTSWWPGEVTPAKARIIQIENNTMKLANGIPADCGLFGEYAAVLRQLNEGLKDHVVSSYWERQIEQCQQAWSEHNEKEGQEMGFPLYPPRIIRTLEKMISDEDLVTLDMGDSTLWFLRNFRAKCKQVILSERWRTMGFGLPAAMAAKCCYPNNRVYCVTGDGGLAMVLADLLTAARYRLQVVVIVLNNGKLQMEYNKMIKMGFVPEGTDITNPDFVKLAESCGWTGYRVHSAEELDKFLQSSRTQSTPVLIEVPTAQVQYPDYPKP